MLNIEVSNATVSLNKKGFRIMDNEGKFHHYCLHKVHEALLEHYRSICSSFLVELNETAEEYEENGQPFNPSEVKLDDMNLYDLNDLGSDVLQILSTKEVNGDIHCCHRAFFDDDVEEYFGGLLKYPLYQVERAFDKRAFNVNCQFIPTLVESLMDITQNELTLLGGINDYSSCTKSD